MRQLTTAALEYVTSRRSTREIAQGTARNYRTTLLHFCEIVGMERNVESITRKDIEYWFADRANKGLVNGSIRYQYQVLRLFFDWAVEVGIIMRNPCAGIKGPKSTESVPRGFVQQDVRTVFDGCTDDRDRLITSLMVREGLRCVEVSRLGAADIDLTGGMMRIWGKGDKERWVPITTETGLLLATYTAEHPLERGKTVLRSYKRPTMGLTPNYVGALIGKVMIDSGVKREAWDGRSAHALRHTFAHALIEAGADIEDARIILGHSSLATTAIYMKRSRASDKIRAAMEGHTYQEEGVA